MRKSVFCICENRGADQLHINRAAIGQRSPSPPLPKYEIPSLRPSSVTVQPGLCGTWSETLETGFLLKGAHLIMVLFQGGGWWRHEFCYGKYAKQYHAVSVQSL